MKRLLLLSNSTNAGEQFFEYPLPHIKTFLEGISAVVFVPFASVSFSFDRYAELVTERLAQIGKKVIALHTAPDPIATINAAEAILVGGGNTFHLLDKCHQLGVLDAIRSKVESGTPYIGWSAGSVLSGPTIQTTNDMPIVAPKSLRSLGLVPFQINAHYTDEVIPGHRGETRDQRLEEYITINKNVNVVGLREGTMLQVEGDAVKLIGEKPIKLFRNGEEPRHVPIDEDLSFLIRN